MARMEHHHHLEELQSVSLCGVICLADKMTFVLRICSDLNTWFYISKSTDFHLSSKYVNARDIRDNVKDNGRRKRKRNGNSDDKKEKQRILVGKYSRQCRMTTVSPSTR